ncbi:centrosomal protein of 164 kDa-like [Scleropages formosus]|uniref:centrosomal protein of 164 kDa-like n=1 Tax=Scleropages formosus TaxID=113540 RepID=UPI0008782FF6|nr:centrosomal protein of 164 kDa-like [Scleropages formosus]
MSFPYSEELLKKEIRQFARDIGINPIEEPDLMWLAQEGIRKPLSAEWKLCLDRTGKKYFFNFSTLDFIYEHPSKEPYRIRVAQERERLRAQSKDVAAKNEKNTKLKEEKKERKEKKPLKAFSAPVSGLGSSPIGLSPEKNVPFSSPDQDDKQHKFSEEEDSEDSDVIVVSRAAPPEKIRSELKVTMVKRQNQYTVKKTEDKKIKHHVFRKDKTELQITSRKGNHKNVKDKSFEKVYK